MIPRRIVRTVPTETSDEVEVFWQIAVDLHPGWETITHRDPIGADEFPLTSPHWQRCKNGAQLAGLIRLEDLWHQGGFYIDSDVELYRALDDLRRHEVFAAWEDDNVVPDAVLAAEAHHPVIRECLDLALDRLQSDSTDWRTGNGAWSTGPGVTTTILPHRDGVALGHPDSFYPVHYTAKHLTRSHVPEPLTFGIHHWNGSWL